CIQSLEFPFTF
nr:immunoglobulin light chain junction region [Macaca mulatta]MOV77269.1 immunoglobulin light chain junction region [Macaca mulatta]MOW07919.1 immunoglobulin light chain junction region [Macaca mulatta]MOW09768.1 immunoglobulin light chain junction region [Macaca mulatta]MOW13282.1 immunoglobulin light chain junction region [Macaca mulatta]